MNRLLIIAGLALSGCLHAGVPLRGGRVGDAGEVHIGLTTTLYGYAPGAVGGTAGNTADRARIEPLFFVPIPAFLIGNTLLDVRVGVGGGVELSAHAAIQGLGGGLRYQARDADGEAVALEAAGELVPASDGFRARIGALRTDADGGGLAAGAWLTLGDEAHVQHYESTCGRALDCGGYSARGGVRRELRLLVLIGGRHPVSPGALGGGVVLHGVLAGWPSERAAWERLRSDDIEERFGVHLIAGGERGF
ncbi:MAG: hypothetical protein H6706_03595 [Myxococcales bacterium]|nr:hypothetical protein [Myxococcales bacterium]